MSFCGVMFTIVFLCWITTCGTSAAAEGASKYLSQPKDWFGSEEAKRVAENIVSYQSDLGGWPKNVDTTATRQQGKQLPPTFDNGATTDELRFLAQIYRATSEPRYRKAFEKGYDYILKAQYPTGGWPQSYPPDGSYHRYITFNDNSMVRLLSFLRETYNLALYGFVDETRKTEARRAFDKGIGCILKCQVRVHGKLTAWCAQHDEKDFSPRPGRAYELISISGSESVGILRLLMSLESPSPEVVAAVESAVQWFLAAELKGIRVEKVQDQKSPKGTDKRVVEDPSAPPMWARFYEIGTNVPTFCDRDGVPKRKLSEIGYERRNGYNWLDYWPRSLLESEYPAWKKKWGHAAIPRSRACSTMRFSSVVGFSAAAAPITKSGPVYTS